MDSATTKIFAAAAAPAAMAVVVVSVLLLLLLSPRLSSSSFCLLLPFLSWSISKRIQALYYFTHTPFTWQLKKYEQFLTWHNAIIKFVLFSFFSHLLTFLYMPISTFKPLSDLRKSVFHIFKKFSFTKKLNLNFFMTTRYQSSFLCTL